MRPPTSCIYLLYPSDGYDLAMDNVDQSPFHKNEAGSKDVCTLSLKGAPTVPLIEGHAATRSRWSANTTTQSDYEEAGPGCEPVCPPLECMFKADGHLLEAKLNQYIRGYGFDWLSVSTSPKATYREEHIIVSTAAVSIVVPTPIGAFWGWICMVHKQRQTCSIAAGTNVSYC